MVSALSTSHPDTPKKISISPKAAGNAFAEGLMHPLTHETELTKDFCVITGVVISNALTGGLFAAEMNAQRMSAGIGHTFKAIDKCTHARTEDDLKNGFYEAGRSAAMFAGLLPIIPSVYAARLAYLQLDKQRN